MIELMIHSEHGLHPGSDGCSMWGVWLLWRGRAPITNIIARSGVYKQWSSAAGVLSVDNQLSDTILLLTRAAFVINVIFEQYDDQHIPLIRTFIQRVQRSDCGLLQDLTDGRAAIQGYGKT